jgi:competence protein ComEC
MLGPLLTMRVPLPEPGAFRFTLLDVGQGLAAVVRTRNHVLVYDTGPGFPSGFNTGSAVVAPFLRRSGVDRVDRLLLSHADQDHAGGADGLLAALPVAEVLSGEPRRLVGIRATACRAGMAWRWDGVQFRILHPGPSASFRGNDRSCVLKVENGAGAVLLTGDVAAKVEKQLVARFGRELRSQVLVAGHHGSADSSASAFLAAVEPRYLLISAGYRNRYGFPRAEVLQRAEAAGAATLETARYGGLQVSFPAVGPVSGWRAYRRDRRRYWTHQIPD